MKIFISCKLKSIVILKAKDFKARTSVNLIQKCLKIAAIPSTNVAWYLPMEWYP